MSDQPKTMQRACDDLDEAWREFALEVAYALKVPAALDWLTRKLSGAPPDDDA